jgi:hypothetical protein
MLLSATKLPSQCRRRCQRELVYSFEWVMQSGAVPQFWHGKYPHLEIARVR